MASPAAEVRRGTLYGAGAYLLWGGFPLYFTLLDPSSPIEILAHRVAWTAVVCVLALTATRGWREVRTVTRSAPTLALLGAAAVLIAVNWGVYIYGVTSGQVVATSLGYFVNPLVTVLLGVLVLRERLRPLQWAAVGTGAVAVVVIAVEDGSPPWIALTLATSFGLYGLAKNRVGRQVGALASLSVETAVLLPAALAVIAWLGLAGAGSLTGPAGTHAVLLMLSGPVTAVPLLLFAAAARRVSLTTVGLLQYVTPVLQLVIAVGVLGEPMPATRWIGFALVWAGLALLTVDLLRALSRVSAAGTATTTGS